MNYKMVGRFLSLMLAIEGLFMIPALLISLGYGEWEAGKAFLQSILIIGAISLFLFLLCRRAQSRFYQREGLLCVGISWVLMSLLGCLPFYISGEIPSFVDAFFETVSGFTTTGASVVANVERLSHGVLYWRSFSHWLGGMGVLVFLLAIIPTGRKNEGFTLHLLRAESPGPNVGKLVPKMRQSAAVLYVTYLVLTVLNFLFLIFGDMPVFDAVCTAFGTAGTGGFSVRNASMGAYSPYLQAVTTVFMLLFGVNFSCYYLLLLGKLRDVFKDEELRLYFGVVFVSIGLITWNLYAQTAQLGTCLHHASFQVASVITTTGFSTVNFDAWPTFSKTILLLLMLIGACAGSTGGGLKCARVLLLFKSLKRNIAQILRPKKVQVVNVNQKPVEESLLTGANLYFALYMLLLFVSFLVISLDNFSLETNLSATFSCFNNIGPGFGAVSPVLNYSGYSALSKLVLSFDMLVGRLEIFPILILFHPRAWKA